MANEDPAYREWVKSRPCCAPGAPHACAGPIDPHHTGRRGIGQRAHDRTCIPLCRKHHTEWDAPDFSTSLGAFHGWTRDQRRTWQDEQVAAHRDLYENGIDYDAMSF